MLKKHSYRFLVTSFFLLCVPCFSSQSLTTKCDLNFKKIRSCGKIDWVIQPKAVEMVTEKDKSEFVIAITPKEKLAKQGDKDFDVKVRLFMPSMGHGSHPTLVVPEYDPQGKRVKGKYRVKNVYFTMAGDWEIQVEIRNNGMLVDNAVYLYSLSK